MVVPRAPPLGLSLFYEWGAVTVMEVPMRLWLSAKESLV
ncbi:protein of unknown function [Rhodovastum atsumiense]|nr:protein of unknown function [Rhodovastum atsumiense]